MAEPLVSIGMPVYNGERFIKQAIDSILAQTFENFELIISDNASTDKTEEICREYAEKDKRIRYYRNEKNLGAALNYDRTFHVSQGKYFKWAAHDDVLAPTFLARTVEVLENSPSVVACCAHTILIDGEGRIINHSNANATTSDRVRQLDSEKPHERYGEILSVRMCFEVFSLIRSDQLKRTSLSGTYYGADKVLLSELSIMGPIVEIPEPLFFNRRHSNQSASLKTVKEREKWIGLMRKHQFISPRLLCVKGYLHAIFKYELSPLEQLACLMVFFQWFVNFDNWQRMISNVIGQYAPKQRMLNYPLLPIIEPLETREGQ
ncbi:MAG: glycosyltransferase family 2 protein [Myxacorys chilensis ATA2-1-KO14]|jgi:glycosyltransferase involved in cell wall biosynthesis|nr:glycosyltransferase family 2 protein [Myxacorys chilensis ATA2-1-KO14]